MADKTLRSITFPGLTGRYVIPEPDVNADLWYDPGLWVEGHLVSSNGALSADPTYNRMCTPELIPANVTRIKVQDGYRIIPYCWSADGSTYLGIWNGSAPVKTWSESNWLTGTVDLKAISTAYRFKILAQQVSNQRQLVPATDADKFVFVSYTDETLTIGGKAADAKATGDRLAAVDAELEEINDAIEDIGADIDEIDERFDIKAPIIIREASGSVASFSDGADGLPMKSLVATIEPVQDLHGYDHPWPAGSGKNLLNPAWYTYGNTYEINGITWTKNSDGTLTANGTATENSSAGFVLNGLFSGNYYFCGNPDLATSVADIFVWNSTQQARCTKWNGTTSSGSSSSASNLQEVKLNNTDAITLTVRIMAGKTVNNVKFYPMLMPSTITNTDFEPYSNICPITGWTGLNGKRTGKNILKYPYALRGSVTHNGVNFTQNNDGSFLVNGTATAYAEKVLYSGYASEIGVESFLKPGEYILSGSSGPVRVTLYTYINNAWTLVARSSNGNPVSITINKGVKYGMSVDVASNNTANNVTVYPMICVDGETDLTWEPYISKDISVNWQTQAGTVYGGSDELIGGKLVVDHAKMIVDGNRALYSISARTKTVRFAVSANPRMPQIVRAAIPVISDVLPTSTSFDFYNGDKLGVCGWSSAENETPGLWMSIPIEAGSTDESVKAWLNANPITCIYPIASPVEYQLTPQEVTTLLGNNVVYTDVGPVTVEYPADTGLVVSQQKNAIDANEESIADTQSMIATVEATTTASKNYAVGDLLVYDGKLYKVTSAIATGTTIIVGSNVTQTTVEDQLGSGGGSGGAVNDVQINGTSILSNGVANIPIAKGIDGVVKIDSSSGAYGLNFYSPTNSMLVIYGATAANVKSGANVYRPITPIRQHDSAFYGLAKAAGDSTQSASDNPVGTYTDDAKAAIQSMLGVAGIVGTVEGATASKAYAIGDAFLHSGALYKATASIASGDAITPGTNCTQTTLISIIKGE